MAAVAAYFEQDPLPAITLHPVPLQPFAGQALQAQAIAMRGWRTCSNHRTVFGEAPAKHRQRFGARKLTAGLRAGEFIAERDVVGDQFELGPPLSYLLPLWWRRAFLMSSELRLKTDFQSKAFE